MKHTEMIMVIEADSEGKVIEVSLKGADHWEISNDPIWDFSRCKYRVKPEPKYQTTSIFESSMKFVEIKALEDAIEIIDTLAGTSGFAPASLIALRSLIN